ncbi:hypothetical protein NGM37_44095, partial [Streptomyces sp. TRM76130]|nr:hypothetical protein [Streptomyces sp. TRM76130]
MFRQSYEGLTRDQQLVFRLLGQLPGDHIETHNVAGLAGLSMAHADILLESLVDAHLLSPSTPGGYVIHELLHVYAAQLAGEVAPASADPGSTSTAPSVCRDTEY